MRLLLYTLFPSLMPKVYQTKNEDPITYTYDDYSGLFIGTNKVRLSVKYVVNNLKPLNKTL